MSTLVSGVDFVSIPTQDLERAVTPNPNFLALHVEDVAAARATLEERGVAFHGDTFDTGVCHMAFFADPDGNALMLHHRYAPRVPEG
jgi:predicted enzyme related to lactoylglutathione lyase